MGSRDPGKVNMGSDFMQAPTRPRPLVALGLPVYNGENYLAQALESLLAQTFGDFELIISDNGSVDGTESICRDFAARDRRIRYVRESRNRGVFWNFNRTFLMSDSPLFRWTAHDDLCEPGLLEACVKAMRERPEIVLAYPRTRVIGPAGESLWEYGTRLLTDAADAATRFRESIAHDHACYHIFGLIRSSVLKRTTLMGAYAGADRNLLAELALHGPFYEIPEPLFLRRDHPGTLSRVYRDPRDMADYVERTEAKRDKGPIHIPTLRRALGYWESLNRAPLSPQDRMACLGVLGRWAAARGRNWVARRMGVPEPLPVAYRVDGVMAAQ